MVYVSKPVWHIPLPCVHWKTPDDAQRNCPKHVEIHSKNKFQNLVNLVHSIISSSSRCLFTWTTNSRRFVLYSCRPLSWNFAILLWPSLYNRNENYVMWKLLHLVSQLLCQKPSFCVRNVSLNGETRHFLMYRSPYKRRPKPFASKQWIMRHAAVLLCSTERFSVWCDVVL